MGTIGPTGGGRGNPGPAGPAGATGPQGPPGSSGGSSAFPFGLTIPGTGSGSGGGALQELIASNSPTLDFTSFISSLYDEYVFELINVVPITNSTQFSWRAGTGGGPTWDSSAIYDSISYYAFNSGSGIDGGSGVGATQANIVNTVSNNTNYGISGYLRLMAPGAAVYKQAVGDIGYQHATVGIIRQMVTATYKNATAVTGIRFLFTSGNIASGTIRVYGIPKTGGGGGGGGNVSTLNPSTIDYGATQLLKRPTAINPEDDMFDAAVLDPKWLAYTGANPTTDLTIMPGWCKTTSAGFKLQPVPAGDWTIETEIILQTTTGGPYQTEGLILTNGTNSAAATDARFGIGHNNSMYGYRIEFEKFVNNAFNATIQDYSQSGTGGGGTVPAILDYMFLRIIKVGTTYAVQYSTTGKTWQQQGSTAALGFVPTHFGFGGTAGPGGDFFNYFVRY